MTNDQKALVSATVPVLKESGVALTSYFYNRMLTQNPELKNVFNMANQVNNRQQTALAMAVLAYAENIENPSVLMPVIDSIAQKHASLNIRSEHYAIVGKHLLASISEVLGEAASPELMDAWTAAYAQLASLMIGHEQEIYNTLINSRNGWTGWRPFVVTEKIAESDEVTSFYLTPADGGKIADFKAGQYLSVRLFIPALNLLQPRQYSISCAPNGSYYRISVKREHETNKPIGMVSNYLHDHINKGDHIEVSAPAGNFILDAETAHLPKVFLSAGVGITPLMAMLESTLQKRDNSQNIKWYHGCRKQSVDAFFSHTESLTKDHSNLKTYYFYSEEEPNLANARKGRINWEQINEEILEPDAVYYVCGPSGFIKDGIAYLQSHQVEKAKIKYEEFGPASFH